MVQFIRMLECGQKRTKDRCLHKDRMWVGNREWRVTAER